jgi:hypothetical protein
MKNQLSVLSAFSTKTFLGSVLIILKVIIK